MSPMRFFLRALAALLLAVAARATPVAFNLPAQPAAAALAAFAKQAGVEVLFAFNDLKNVRTTAVVGTLEPEAALAQLLRATGFVATRNASGKFVIVRERRLASTGEIHGSVVTQATGAPVADALVRAAGTGAVARTRADGRFVLRGISSDAVAVVVQAEGFAALRVADVTVPGGRRLELAPVQLRAAGSPEQLAEMVVNADDLGATSAPLLFSLQAMIVTPSRYGIEEERGNVAATLTESDLIALPQLGEDLYRAISHLPGLAADDLTARFWVRGAPHEQVLARLDGVELIEPFHLKDTDSSLSILDLETISRLNLYTGGFTAEFGDRLAGVLTMETDSYARAKPRTTLGLSLTGARAASRGQTADGRGRWLLSARTGYPDLALDQTDAGDSSGQIRPRYHDLMGKWEWQLTPDHVLSFHALHAGDRMIFRDTDGSVLSSRYGSDYAWARWQGSFGRLAGEAVLSYSHLEWRRDGSGLIDGSQPIQMHERRSLDVVGLRQDWTASLSERALVRGGLELKSAETDYTYHSQHDSQVFRNGAIVTDRTTHDARLAPDGRTAGAYVALRFQPTPALTLEPGLRYDGNDYAHDSGVSPRFNAALHLGATTLRAAWGQYEQAQGLQALQVQDGDTSFRPAERAEHRVLSVEHRLDSGLNLRLEAYERLVRRPRPHWENVLGGTDAIAEVESDRVRLDPVRMQARGIELIAEQRSGAHLAWSASYAFARTEETLTSGVTLPRVRDQRHTLYVDATYTPNARWQFSTAWQYHTGWPTTEINFARQNLAGGGTTIVGFYGAPYGLRLPPYQRLDLRVQRRFQLRRGLLRAYLDVFNVLNRENTIDYGYRLSNAPNGALVTTRVRGDTLFPILPSVGITWDF